MRAVLQLGGAGVPRGEQLAAATAEARVQLADEVDGLAGQDLRLRAGRVDFQFHGRVPLIEWSSRVIGW